jgi:glycosyltransferase involved in cell wall biosynthesis
LNDVLVFGNPSCLQLPWDLIVVHGDGSGQNYAHYSDNLGGPVFYALCRPDEKLDVMKVGMQKARWIGCATSFDFAFAKKYGHDAKIVDMKGYPIECVPIEKPDRNKFGITEEKVYISCGGFWPHKRFEDIAEAFIKVKPPNTELILTGYDMRHGVSAFEKRGRDAGVKIQAFLADDSVNIYELMALSDLYIWNSLPGSEGFGLVLLESMYYNLPWIGVDTAAAYDLSRFTGLGKTYTTREELEKLMLNPPQKEPQYRADDFRRFVVDNYNTEALLRRIFQVLE